MAKIEDIGIKNIAINSIPNGITIKKKRSMIGINPKTKLKTEKISYFCSEDFLPIIIIVLWY